MRTLFVCATPYQIMLALHIKNSFKIKGSIDLFILNHFNNSEEVACRLRTTDYFDTVKHINCINLSESLLGKNRFVKKMYAFLKSSNIVNKYYGLNDLYYDHIYFSYPDLIIQLLLIEIYKSNSELRVHLFEAGTGGYTTGTTLNTSLYKKIFNKVTGYGNVLDCYDSILMFRPDMFTGDTNIPKIDIPFIDVNNTPQLESINHIFEYRDNYQINERIIFFEQPLISFEGLDEKISSIANNLFEDTDDYIVKLHPRSNTKSYENLNTYEYNSLPWEVINLNQNIEDKILISYYSTALTSNKIIFDQEPILIFLFNMYELKKLHVLDLGSQGLAYKLKEIYREPNRVFMPKNIYELKNCISDLQNFM